MKRFKKNILSLLMVLTLVMSASLSAFASNKNMSIDNKKEFVEVFKGLTTKPVVELDTNKSYSTHRHIKIRWNKVRNITVYQIEFADNKYFKSSVKKICTEGHGLYWNYSVSDNVEADCYIRVRPAYYLINKDKTRKYTLYGIWSDLVIASYKE